MFKRIVWCSVLPTNVVYTHNSILNCNPCISHQYDLHSHDMLYHVQSVDSDVVQTDKNGTWDLDYHFTIW